MILPQLWLGFLLAAGIALIAAAAGALSPSGALAAALVGGVTFGIGGLVPGALLILFFLTSSGLSWVGGRRKATLAGGFEKGKRRDAGQVLANGGVAALLSVVYGVGGGAGALAAIAGALAAANADTWATEIGVLVGGRPRRITDGQRVPPGTSGAVSLAGSLAAAGGGALIAVAAGGAAGSAVLALAAWAGGVAGAVVDSLLGASLQAMYACAACGQETERHPYHGCGGATRRVRGYAWLRNDGVNLAASLAGAAISLAIWAAAGQAGVF